LLPTRELRGTNDESPQFAQIPAQPAPQQSAGAAQRPRLRHQQDPAPVQGPPGLKPGTRFRSRTFAYFAGYGRGLRPYNRPMTARFAAFAPACLLALGLAMPVCAHAQAQPPAAAEPEKPREAKPDRGPSIDVLFEAL